MQSTIQPNSGSFDSKSSRVEQLEHRKSSTRMTDKHPGCQDGRRICSRRASSGHSDPIGKSEDDLRKWSGGLGRCAVSRFGMIVKLSFECTMDVNQSNRISATFAANIGTITPSFVDPVKRVRFYLLVFLFLAV
jgi:hypothetical protein